MEKKYQKQREKLAWDDPSYLNENYLYLSDLFGKLYLKFVTLFFPATLKREALMLLHRFPFSKVSRMKIFIKFIEQVSKLFNLLPERRC
jgi:hypothetical protein